MSYFSFIFVFFSFTVIFVAFDKDILLLLTATLPPPARFGAPTPCAAEPAHTGPSTPASPALSDAVPRRTAARHHHLHSAKATATKPSGTCLLADVVELLAAPPSPAAFFDFFDLHMLLLASVR